MTCNHGITTAYSAELNVKQSCNWM